MKKLDGDEDSRETGGGGKIVFIGPPPKMQL